MTPTAQLSVGLNTSAAKASLLELKKFLGESVRNVAVSIDPTSIDRQIAGYFKQRTFKFRVDPNSFKDISGEIKDQISRGVADAFKTVDGRVRELRWNRDQFYGSLKTAIDGQFGNRQRRLEFDRTSFVASIQEALKLAFATPQQVKVAADVTAMGAASPVATAQRQVEMATIASTITAALTPAVDELGKAAAVVGGVARQGGLAQTTSRLSSSTSFIDPATGLRTSVRLPVPTEQQTSVIAQAREEARSSLRSGSAGRIDPRTILGLPSRDQMKSIGQEIAAQFRQGAEEAALRQRAASRIDARTLLGLPSRDQMKSMGQEIAAQFRQGAQEATLRQRAASRIDARTLLGLPSRDQMKSMGQEIAAQMRQQVEQETLAARQFFENARLRLRNQYTGPGASIAAAQETSSKFGRDATSAMLGNRAFLLDQSSALGDLKVKTDEVTRSHVNWGAAVRELHSGARGLMGTLGAMWLTWGSIVPLLAGAAVGQSLRTIVNVGRELEYQLKFVQVLSSGAAVSMRDFTSAVAGSVVGPVEAANALRGLAQNGLDAKQAIMALPDVLRLATVGEMDLASAALGATGVMEAFNLRFYDLGRVGDVFAAAAASSNTSVESMVESMKQASTVADQYKLTIEEVAASLAVLAQRNITGSAAGTAFRNMMSDLAAPSEKAKRALAAVGVSIFDANRQVKPFMTVMEEMKKALAGLNEQSRKEVIGAIFDERGQKSFENLVNNFDDLKLRIDDLGNSAGFMRQVVDALGDTTSGKISRLAASFNLVAAEVFNSSEGVKNLVDEMRLLVSSDGFKSSLQGIAEVTLNVTRFLTENVATIAMTGAAWLAFRGVVGATSAVIAGVPAVAAIATTALARLGAAAGAAKLALGFMTGGLGLAALLGVEFLLLGRNTSAAREASEAYQNQVKLMNQTIDQSIAELERKNAAVREEIELMYRGVTAVEAKRRAEQSSEMNPLKTREADLAANVSYLEDQVQSGAADQEVVRSLNRDRQSLAQVRKEIAAMEAKVDRESDSAARLRSDSERRSMIEQAQDLNNRIKDAKLKVQVPLIDIASLRGLSDKEVKDLVSRTREQFNRAARTVSIADNDRALNRALISDATGDVREMKAEFDERVRLAEQLREAQIGSVNMGPVLTAELAVQRARERSVETVRVYAAMLERLDAVKGAAKDDAARVRLDGDIDRLRQQQARELFKLDRETEIAQAKRDTALRERSGTTDKDLAGINANVDEQIRKRREKSELKVVDAVEAARAEASAAAMAEFARKIAEQEALISAQKQASQFLKDKELAAASQQISIEEEILAIYREQARVAGKKAGDSAAQVQSESMTAEYGMKRFWTEYQNQAESTADQVYSVMKFSVDGMNKLFADFRTTGKMNFKDFATSVIMEITRIMTSRAIFDFTKFLMKSMGLEGPGTGVPKPSVFDGAGLFGGTFSFANGGVMTSSGPIPLRRFANGGVGYGPMAAIHSEWTKPEAYVPLPDGRTIPVTVSSQQQAAPIQLSYAPVIHIDSRTDREDVFRGVDERIQAGNQAMIQHLRDTRVIA